MRIVYHTACWALLLASSLLFSCDNNQTPATADPPTTEPPITTAVEPRQTLETFRWSDCKGMDDGGCSCSYTAKGAGPKAPFLFVYDKMETACVKVAGQLISLKSEEYDYIVLLQERTQSEAGQAKRLFLPKRGTLQVYGAPVPDDYPLEEYLVHLFGYAGDVPSEVAIDSEIEGAAVQELQRVVTAAITEARRRIRENEPIIPKKAHVFYNEQYEVIVDSKKMTEYEGEANIYEGDLTLKDNNGTVLHMQPVSGSCGC